MKIISKAIIISLVLVVAGAAFVGCSSASTSNRNANNNALHPKEYYEGYWACSGYEKNGTVVAYDKLSPEEKESFPYFDFELKEGRRATLNRIDSNGKPDVAFMGEWDATNKGIRIDDAELVLDDGWLIAPGDEVQLYFERCISGNQLNVNTIEFEGVSFDAPVDLAYAHNGISPESNSYGIASSTRAYGPSLVMTATPTDAQEITELLEAYEGWEDYYTSFDGVTYNVLADEGTHGALVQFVANGKWYRIDFTYSEKDPVDYSEYAATFYSTITFNGDAA